MIDGISDHEVSYVLAPSEHPIERSIYLWSRAKLRHDMQSSCDEFIATYSASMPVANMHMCTCSNALKLVMHRYHFFTTNPIPSTY